MKSQLLAGAAFGALALVMAQPAFADDAVESSVEELVVIGQGESRQVQTVGGDELTVEVAGASPLKLVDKLPNVNMQSADAFGSYEWAVRISIRGFSQNQLGFTLDGVPLGDMSYGNQDGLHISRAISSENIGQVELSQGAGALETAAANNLGGTLSFLSRDPSTEFGGLAAATVGSNSAYRGFLRIDSGELASGGRGYLSFSQSGTDKWKGVGEQKHTQVNFKAIQPIGRATLTGWVNWSKRRENDYQDMSLEMLGRLGRNWDNNSGDWQQAIAIAEVGNNTGYTGVPPKFPSFGTTYPGAITSADDTYFNAAGLRDDWIGALTFEMPVTDILDVKATYYRHTNKGQGQWATPYVPSPNYGLAGATANDAPISIRTTEYDIERQGLVASATLTLGAHAINGGFWIDGNDFTQARRYYGLNRAAPQRNFLNMQSGSFRTDWEYAFNTKTRKFHIQDTWTVSDALTVNFGFKALTVENEGKTVFVISPTLAKNGAIKAEESFLPQAGMRYAFSPDSEVFASYSRNMRAFPSSGTAGPFSTTAAGFLAIKDTLKPEISDTFEAGWRYRTSTFQGLIAVYHVKFKDRLFGVPVGSGIQGNPPALQNVGGVTATGFEAAGDWRFADNWSLFGSYAYNDSTYDDDTFDGNGALIARTAGKTTVDTPKNLLKAQLGYDDGAFYAKAGLSYMSKRFFNYENDRSVGSQALADLSVGYRFSGTPLLEGLELQANVTNLFDKDYIGTIGTNGFPLRGDAQTLMPGAPRQVFVTVRKSF